MPDPTAPPTGVTNTEPLTLKAAVVALAQLAVAGLVVFDVWQPTADQMAWIMGAMAVVGGLLDALVRTKVWSPASVAKVVAEAEAQVPEEVAAQLAAARSKAAVADQIVARLGPPPSADAVTFIPVPRSAVLLPGVGPVGGRSGPGTEGND